MLDHDLADFGQFMTPGASVVRQLDRVEPELRITTGVSHMDVRRLPALQTVEEESITSNPQKRRHETSLPCVVSPLPKSTWVILDCLTLRLSGGAQRRPLHAAVGRHGLHAPARTPALKQEIQKRAFETTPVMLHQICGAKHSPLWERAARSP